MSILFGLQAMGRIAIISPDAPDEIMKNLSAMDIEPFPIPKTGLVAPTIAGHPDIQMFVHDNHVFCHPDMPESFIKKIERHAEITICPTRLSPVHPADISYNIACAGSWAFHRRQHTDPLLRGYLEKRGIALIDIRQGYAGCSTLVVGRDSIITADASIYSAATACGADSLLITPGHIDLPGHNYGFIGGATGVTGDLILVTGDLSYHPDCEEITDFIEAHEKKIVPLGLSRPLDLGTIFVLDDRR